MPAPVIAALITAGASGAATVYSAKKNKQAADLQLGAENKAAELTKQTADETLAFQRQQAENDWLASERAQRANYDQWAAREGRLSSLGAMLGQGPRNVPAYVPGVDPHFDTGATPLPSTTTASPQAASTAPGGTPSSYLLSLVQGGTDPQQAAQMANEKFNLQTGAQAVYYPDTNTIGLPDVYLSGPTNRPDSPQGWGIVPRQNRGAAANAQRAPLSFASMVAPMPTGPGVLTPALSATDTYTPAARRFSFADMVA